MHKAISQVLCFLDDLHIGNKNENFSATKRVFADTLTNHYYPSAGTIFSFVSKVPAQFISKDGCHLLEPRFLSDLARSAMQ